ncbi:hypothetical protein B0H15DRAFT_386966 [Mycena belliarum]|uniref:Uncharacterized protein n=1 Tax=Mycena belliarum TaxID=1033014 RepID=A0AAD6XME2_9AGAR|nr:hypothetical protein B0H15DRAFT_386966 [Mycena belliae]
MLFNTFQCFSFFLLLFSYAQQVSALAFDPIVGPFVSGTQVPLTWRLDGSEPADGWELWFTSDGSGVKIANIPPLSVSAVIPFPNLGNGTFAGLSGLTVLAISNQVDIVLEANLVFTATATFSASVISGSATIAGVPPVRSSTVETSRPSRSVAVAAVGASSQFNTNVVLGIIVGTLIVIAIIVFLSIYLFVKRRRRLVEYRDPYPAADSEKQLANALTPFSGQPMLQAPRSVPLLHSPAPPAPRHSGNSHRQAYLDAQLQRLDTQHAPGYDTASIVFGPLSSVPSVSEASARPYEHDRTTLPTIPEAGSRRDAYLSAQLLKLAELAEVDQRRPDEGSVVFGPLSSVPSETSEGNALPYVHDRTTLPTIPEAGSRRDAYLSQQLQKLAIVDQRRPDSGSVVFGPLSSVPSETSEGNALPYVHDRTTLSTIPEAGSRRDAYLSQQLHKLAIADQMELSEGSVVFGPLSSVPSETSEGTVRPYAPSIVSSDGSPIQFQRGPAGPRLR